MDCFTSFIRIEMKKKILIILLIFAAGTRMYSQQLGIGFKSGLGTYSMSELKTLNESMQPDFDAKLVTDFPPYFFYKPSLLLRLEQFTIGLTYTFQSTGSRISAKDYSGEFRFDMKLHSNNLGVITSMDLMKRNRSRFSIYAEPGLSFSKLEINQYLYLLNTVIHDQTLRFKALNYYFEPGINYSYSIIPAVSISMNLGYYSQIGKKNFHKDGEKDNEMANPITHETIKPQWRGLRFGITLMYNINPTIEKTVPAGI